MDHDRVDLTRELAAALWRSGSRAYGRTLDHWLAAEQMVTESLTLAPKTDATVAAPAGCQRLQRWPCSLPDTAFPVDQVRDLAYYFWVNSENTTGAGELDFWLAAERHINAMCAATIDGAQEALDAFSASAHWARIRDRAEELWQADGCRSGRDLDHWLQAERELLADIVAAGRRQRSQRDGEAAHSVCYLQAQQALPEARPN